LEHMVHGFFMSTTMVLGEWEQFFWEWLSSLRWRLSKTNIKMIKRIELKISNWEREREREREDSINTIFCININVLAIVTTNIILEDKNPCYCLVFTPYDPVFGWTSHPMAEDFFGVSGPFC
jgi:hypothetical protein